MLFSLDAMLAVTMSISGLGTPQEARLPLLEDVAGKRNCMLSSPLLLFDDISLLIEIRDGFAGDGDSAEVISSKCRPGPGVIIG
jgi:hypothetical protein